MSYLQKLKELHESEIKSVKLFKQTSPIQVELAILSKKEQGFCYYVYNQSPSDRYVNTIKHKHWLKPKFNKLKK